MTHYAKMKARTEKLIVKRGATPASAEASIKENFDVAFKSCADASASWYADFCVSV